MHLTGELILDRRGFERAATTASIHIRPIGAINCQVALHDVSQAGCRVDLLEPAQVGEPLIARFPQLEPIVGEVRWTSGVTAGLEFSRPMHPAVLDAVVARLH